MIKNATLHTGPGMNAPSSSDVDPSHMRRVHQAQLCPSAERRLDDLGPAEVRQVLPLQVEVGLSRPNVAQVPQSETATSGQRICRTRQSAR